MTRNSSPKTSCGSFFRCFPPGKLVFAVDRTHWQHGQADLNLLVLGVVVSGVTLPLIWEALPPCGNSDSAARMRLVARLLNHLPAIECTFSALKSRGGGLEETHLVKAARVERLFGLLTLALVWMVRVGTWREETRAIPVKQHGRKAMSVAQYGWECLADALRWSGNALQTCLTLRSTPFPAPGAAGGQVVRY